MPSARHKKKSAKKSSKTKQQQIVRLREQLKNVQKLVVGSRLCETKAAAISHVDRARLTFAGAAK